jgi:AcrR family transcriptional regulator
MNRRVEIVRRAAEIFARQGVAQTSMEDIAAAVGIKREGVYYYFKSRGDILLEIILPQSSVLLRNLQRIIQSTASPADKLRSAIGSHLDSYNPNYIEMSVALREDHFVQDHTQFVKLRTAWNEYETIWTDLIVEGQQAGVFSANLDAKLVTFGILGMCNWVCRWYRPEGGISINDIADTYSSIIMTGLITSASPPTPGPPTPGLEPPALLPVGAK